jgi:hypothetical protein
MYITKISPTRKLSLLKTSEYLPLDVQVGDSEPTALYFRCVSDYSLLEVGVFPRDGTLTSIKLVQVPAISTGEFPIPSSPVEDGLPVFDVSLWGGKRFLDIDRSVEIFLNSNSVFLLVDPKRKVNKSSQSQGISFGMSDGYPCWLRVDNLSDEQIKIIRKTIEQSSSGGFM